MVLRSQRSGRPTSGFSVGMRHVRFTGKVVCSGVCRHRYAITIFTSASRLIVSSIRTSSVDTSLTSTSGGSLRPTTISAMRSTSAALFTVYGTEVMNTVCPLREGAPASQVARRRTAPEPVL